MITYLENLDLSNNNINEIQKALEYTRNELELEIKNENSIYNDNTKFQLERLINLIYKKDILKMPLSNIERYINDLIGIIKFITGEYFSN